MTPRDDWMMGALAAQDAYRGAYPDWPAPGEAPAGPMGALAREDNYAPTDAELDRARNPPMPRAPAMGDWAATDRGPILPDAGGAQLGAIGNVMRRLAPKGIAAAEYYVGTPSRAVAGPDIGDYPPGSEEAEFLRQRHAKNLQDWSQSTALGMVADPLTLWGMRGTVGSGAGSKIIQPQPKMGDLAEPPTLPAPWLDPTLARQIQRATREGGSTTNVNTGESPTSGLMMGIYKNADPRAFNTPGRVTQADLENFVQTNRSALRLAGRSDLVGPRQPGDRYLGTWRDPDTGVAYVDVSQRFDPDQIRQATKFGERTGQIAGWDLGAKVPIPVGNWPAYITEPAFHQRMHEMADVGRQYLSQHPTREWWTNEPFARVYGEERMPQVAGYTAATAPNAAPRENLQTMSEYMRRHIRGEPVLQPDWRVPEGMMTRSPGAQIGMEQSRALNLDRAFRGATSELQRQKVREEAQALLGDQWAVVLDRHWARLAEDPSRGVFANAQEGVISSAPRKGPTDYDLLKTEVTKAAQVAGRTPNGFSADVWTGIRDTIQRTSELYGQKFRGSAITGESKSYADHFEDLIRDKAQHLGITAGEMEKRLRSGDANLMSWVLATTPAAWQAYRQYQGHTASSSSGKIQPSAGGPRTGRDEL